MSTSSRPDKSYQIKSMKNGQKVSTNANLMNEMAQNAHFRSPCLEIKTAFTCPFCPYESELMKCISIRLIQFVNFCIMTSNVNNELSCLK